MADLEEAEARLEEIEDRPRALPRPVVRETRGARRGVRLGDTVFMPALKAEGKKPLSQGDPKRDPAWSSFAAGLPHPNDWHPLAPGSLDALIDCPPGQYLFFRLRLLGDGRNGGEQDEHHCTRRRA